MKHATVHLLVNTTTFLVDFSSRDLEITIQKVTSNRQGSLQINELATVYLKKMSN